MGSNSKLGHPPFPAPNLSKGRDVDSGKALDWWLVMGLIPGWSRDNFLCWLFWFQFYPCVTAVVRKIPKPFCEKCRWQVTAKHPHIHDSTKSEWADNALQALYGNLSGKPAHMQLVHSQLSLLSYCGLLHGIKSELGLHKLNSTLKKKEKKSACWDWFVEPSPTILAHKEKPLFPASHSLRAVATVLSFWGDEELQTGVLQMHACSRSIGSKTELP